MVPTIFFPRISVRAADSGSAGRLMPVAKGCHDSTQTQFTLNGTGTALDRTFVGIIAALILWREMDIIDPAAILANHSSKCVAESSHS
ncbi:hypothetical protein ILFOPFJJ_04516 [Ensifer psoraleae]|nr:hypothetical protein [Sinorhizobium psoraleae]